MRETVQTGGLHEIHYPKGYKPQRNESDEMRTKRIKEYYEQEEKRKLKKQILYSKIKKIVVYFILIILILFLFIKLK